MPDELEWRPSNRRVLRRRQVVAVQRPARPAALPAAVARLAPADGPRGPAAAAPRPRRARVRERDGARVGDPRDGTPGVGEGLGPAAARQVRRPRRRHLDGVAVEQAHRSPPDQGRGGAPGAARLPARELGDAVRAAPGVDRVPRRPRDDRPPGADAWLARDGRLRRGAGRAGLVPRGPRPARVRAGGRARRALRRGHRDRAERHLRRSCSTPSWPRRSARTTSAGSTRSSTTRRSACCSSSTGSSRRSTGRTSPTTSCRSSA